MAGRGRRIIGEDEEIIFPPKIEEIMPYILKPTNVTLQVVIDHLNKIDIDTVDQKIIHDAIKLAMPLCSSEDAVTELVKNLYSKAITDREFGMKFVFFIKPISHLIISEVHIQRVVIGSAQENYESKQLAFETDRQKFLNGMALLGYIYNAVTPKRFNFMGSALLDYMRMLINGEEKELEVLAEQVVINGADIIESNNAEQTFDEFAYSLRQNLVKKSLTERARIWSLLIVDCITNNFKPLEGMTQTFYVNCLGFPYQQLEKMKRNLTKLRKSCNHSLNSSITNVSPQDCTIKSDLSKSLNNESKSDEFFQDIQNLSIKAPSRAISKTFVPRVQKGLNRPGNITSRGKTREEGRLKGERPGISIKKGSVIKNENVNEDEWYGIQIEREKFVKNPGKKKINKKTDSTSNSSQIASGKSENTPGEATSSQIDSAQLVTGSTEIGKMSSP